MGVERSRKDSVPSESSSKARGDSKRIPGPQFQASSESVGQAVSPEAEGKGDDECLDERLSYVTYTRGSTSDASEKRSARKKSNTKQEQPFSSLNDRRSREVNLMRSLR